MNFKAMALFLALGSGIACAALAQDQPVPDAPVSAFGQLQAIASAQHAPLQSYACCKHCSKGKACGDSCISRVKTCRKGPGCACD
ncbi:hypothetical protein [Rhodobacter lacus]|uniref:Uncharacterized protein n=1 Tax=Rhodobacter lacus TaxID=1641972 RepID=A0ABW5AD94_9RHOB